jgi:hypothetical protein
MGNWNSQTEYDLPDDKESDISNLIFNLKNRNI